MLEYDNSAFYYFALTLLVIYIIPGTYYALSEFIAAFLGSGEVGAKARTKQEKAKAQELKKQTTGWARLNTTTYITNLIFLVVAWTILIYLMSLVQNNGDVSTFDPYTILGLEQGATVAQIKKQYRALSLKFHPDKNIGNKAAEEMFMKIAKAYEALTDETAKENYEKYGNPDGKQALEVSIGLPKILLDNPKVVLVLYLIAMVIVIPSAVGYWYANSKQYGEKNILYETYEAFYSLLQEGHRVKNLPEILAASAEFRAINQPKETDNEPMNQLYETMKREKVMVKPRFEQPKILRGNLLLHAHMMRMTEKLNEPLKKDLKAMLIKSPDLLEGLIEIASYRKWFETAISAIKLNQSLVQAIWSSSSSYEPFLQLPFLTEEGIARIKGGLSSPSLSSFLALNREEKKKLLSLLPLSLSREDEEELLAAADLFPRMKIEAKLFVEEEDDEEEEEDNERGGGGAATATTVTPTTSGEVKGDQIFEQDLVTLKLSFTRENLPSSQDTSKKTQKMNNNKKKKKTSSSSSSKSSASPVYAPHFPATVYENWWVIVTDKTNKKAVTATKAGGGGANSSAPLVVHAFEKISSDNSADRDFSHEVKFYAPSTAGSYEVEVSVYCDAYLGLDQTFSLPFTVHPAADLPEYTPHPEDVELDNEPTVFEQLMAANQDDSSDDDDDEDEGEGDDEEDHSGHHHPPGISHGHSHSHGQSKKKKKKNTTTANQTNNSNSNNSSNNQVKKNKKKPARVIEEVDEDDEDE